MATLAMFLCRRTARRTYRRLQSASQRAAAWAASTSKKRNKELPCLVMCPSRWESFRWLNRAYEERSICISGIKFDPRLDPIRPDPRYDALVRKLNFPQ